MIPTAPRCTVCRHPDHMHNRAGCHAIDVTGPASIAGRAHGDNFHHHGRHETPCDCKEMRA